MKKCNVCKVPRKTKLIKSGLLFCVYNVYKGQVPQRTFIIRVSLICSKSLQTFEKNCKTLILAKFYPKTWFLSLYHVKKFKT